MNVAIRIKPDEPQLYATRADIHRDMGNRAAVIADLVKVTELRPRAAAEALPDAEKALKESPNMASAIDTQAHILEALGRREEAIAAYRKALSIQPNLKESADRLHRLGASK